jgi:hypothetical protein
MKTILKCLAFVFFVFNPLQAEEFDQSSRYISAEILPLCNGNGQIILQLTNVSGQDLLIDPRYMLPSQFDAHNLGLYLGVVDGVFIPTKRLQREEVSSDRLYPLAMGESVQHEVDFRDYIQIPLDYSLQYAPILNGAVINIITIKEGKRVVAFMDTLDEYESDIFGPECWK